VIAILNNFENLLKPDKMDSSPAAREHASQDPADASDAQLLAVLRPKDAEAFAADIALERKYGLPLYPRGSGMSYTSGYLLQQSSALCLDLCDLNYVFEINIASRVISTTLPSGWAYNIC
jgi:FAD/FMN-containing dehydrogenase